MPVRVVVAFVEVQNCVQMQLRVCPSHQRGNQFRRFARIVDVVSQIADAVDNNQAKIFRSVNLVLYDFQAQIGCKLPKCKENKIWRLNFRCQSKSKMRFKTLLQWNLLCSVSTYRIFLFSSGKVAE